MPTDDRPHKKWYRDNRPKNPSYHRRAAWNDYQQPRIYMLTMVTNHPTPPLSYISGDGREINLTKTPTGLLVEQALTQWNRRWPEFKVDNLVIMPDHIHFILNVTATLVVPFSRLISEFKVDCTRLFRDRFPDSTLAKERLPFFQKNFHDRILSHQGQLAAMHHYLNDNPRRHLLKRLHPDLFTRINHLRIGESDYSAFGNIFLLREVEKKAVIIRSHYSDMEISRLRESWGKTSERGGVLVSPFISPREREVMKSTLDNGYRIIKILPNGFPDRFKPAGNMFDHCLNGRLLYIAPGIHNTGKTLLSREKCQEMNTLANLICSLKPDDALKFSRG